MKKNKSKKSKKALSVEEKIELEKLAILTKTDETKGEQLVLTESGLETQNEIKKFALGNIDNPEQKYDIYYKGVMKLLRKYLPKGNENKKARKYIYEEKNTLLTRGKRINEKGIRGADSRMAYIADIEILLNIITKWIVSKGTMVELFNNLRDLNVSKGYGNPKYIKK